ncbi:MAG: hypothetical protein ACKA35_01135 [Candidatus Karelsulcia muelleri]
MLIQKQINNILPLKLADCSSNNHNLCEIYLQGKILNVEKSIKEKIF